MNKCLTYKCIIILLIGYVYSADKPPGQPTGNEYDSDEDDNFNVIVRGIENLLEEEDDQQFQSIQTAPIQQPTHPTPHTSQVTQFPQYYEPTPLHPLTEPSHYTVDYPGYHTHQQYYTVHQPFPQYPTQSVAGQQPYQLPQSQYPPQPTDKPKEQKGNITTSDDELDDGIEYEIYLQEFKEEWASIEPVIPQLPLTMFLKKDSSGNLIPMNKSDLVLKMDCKSFTKVDFIGNCSKFYQNKQFVWVNKDRLAYPISLIYKKYTNMFNLIFCDKILSFKPYFQKWMMKVFFIPSFLSFYTEDEGGNDIKLSPEQYDVELCVNYIFKYVFRKKTNCTMVMVHDEIVYKRHPNEGHIKFITYATQYNMVRVFFYTKVLDCIKDNGMWMCVISKGKKY